MATRPCIDLNADLGEGYGQGLLANDAEMLGIVTSANIACGGHAGDTETMFATLTEARARGVTIGAHPSYADKPGFGRRIIPMSMADIERMVAGQIGDLMDAAALVGVPVRYVKVHGALANLAADDRNVADAIARATRAVSRDLALLAISGTDLEDAGNTAGLHVFSEVFADRAYLPSGRLVPRSDPRAMIEDADLAAGRLVDFLASGLMSTLDGPAIVLAAQSVCVHGDTPGAVDMARKIRSSLGQVGITVNAFLPPA
jgi:5-oxoprolinase (ATP-hydrolysing) subunit A